MLGRDAGRDQVVAEAALAFVGNEGGGSEDACQFWIGLKKGEVA